MTFRLVFLSVSLVAVSACDSNALTSPSRDPSLLAPLPPLLRQDSSGRIRLTSISAPDGAVIQAVNCPNSYGFKELVCTQNWSGTFDVDFDTPIENALLIVQFAGDNGDCGIAFSPTEPFAGGQQRIVVSGINFNEMQEDGSVLSRCTLPRTTTRMIAKFWATRNPREPLLTQTFDQKYSFEKR